MSPLQLILASAAFVFSVVEIPRSPHPADEPTSEEAGRAHDPPERGAADAGEGRKAAPGRAPAAAAGKQTVRALGYASLPAERLDGSELRSQVEAIEALCEQRGWEFVELVSDVEPPNGRGLARPGLGYVLERIAQGEASCLVVSGLDRLSRSVAEIGTLLEWFEHSGARLVAVDLRFDTAAPDGRVAAQALAAVSAWERERLGRCTRRGLEAARAKGRAISRPSVVDRPALKKRIVAMRAQGMTLQAIADTLNEESVPTLRGGVKWRPSSVHAAAGHKRPTRRSGLDNLPSPATPQEAIELEPEQPDEREGSG
jgi:DNA invertase Pin-like site-specific DNA recombinase